MRPFFRSVVVAVMLGTLIATHALAQNPVMPEDLLRIAEGKQCSQIDDFFRRPGPVGPPYLYGFEGTANAASAIFWCRVRDPAAAMPYRLIVVGQPKVAGNCPADLAWWNPPGGLSIEAVRSVDLVGTRYLKDPTRPGPATRRRVAGIMSSYDGVESIFYCYDGEWIFRTRH